MLIKVGVVIYFGARLGALGFAAALVGYYVFTVGLAVRRIRKDVRQHLSTVPGSA
jgi:hypothetical protein